MKWGRHIMAALLIGILSLSFGTIEVKAGHCAGHADDCGCNTTSCSSIMVCYYNSPWDYCDGHNFGNTWTYVSTSATCTGTGYQQWRGYCSICKQWYELYLPDGPLGHNYGGWSNYSNTQHVRSCTRCGVKDYGNHSMGNWYDGGDGWEYRDCNACNYREKRDRAKPSISTFSATPNQWSAGNGTIKLTVRDKGSGIDTIVITRVNVNSDATKVVGSYNHNGSTSSITETYVETDEGVFYYTAKVTDKAGNVSTSTSATIYIDHSHPAINGVENTVTDWTNVAPTISVSATDYLYGTSYNGSGLSKIVIKDDAGSIVASGINSTSYTLAKKYEGKHTWTITATDNVGHTSTRTVTTKYDCTAPGIDGTEITFVTPDGKTVSGYCQDNIISQHIDDEISRSPNGANLSSGVKSVILYRVTGNTREVINTNRTKKIFTSSDTHSYFDMYYEIADTEKRVSYYEIIVVDFAGNTVKKKLTSQYSLLSWFHTSIDRSSYE